MLRSAADIEKIAACYAQLGLTRTQARQRLERDGYNELPSAKPKTAQRIALEVIREPMFLLLLAAASIYFVLGDVHEALALTASVFVIIGITFVQERKTERALEALRELSSPRALVLRDGQAERIAGRELVCGDVVLLEEGDRVPADAILLSCNDLMADEALLTGESAPARKRARDADESAAPASHPTAAECEIISPQVFSGTLITQGSGMAEITATGMRTEIGIIGKSLQSLAPEPSPLQLEMRSAVLIFATIGLALCLLVVVLYGLLRGDWLAGLLAGITLAMSNLPEEIPVVLTVFLALGARRIARRGVLTRRANAIETLGATTVLCVDKTGTLTLNRMTVRQLCAGGDVLAVDDDAALPKKFHDLVIFSVLSSEADPFDPMEKAFRELGSRALGAELQQYQDWLLEREYPLSHALLAHSHLWRTRGGYQLATKGAPETIAELCRLDPGARAALAQRIEDMAGAGLRVLGVARSHPIGTAAAWPESQRDFDYEFLGLVGLADPVRSGVPAALRECHTAGIRTVMITGDYPSTARAIAQQAGLTRSAGIMTGAQLEALSDLQLAQRIDDIDIFARVVPHQKLRIVEAFKRAGAVVAMTGDGVNDAPALKAAHIGIAMGKRGTDVAREAASLVLLQDDFAAIVHAVRLGRRIFDNIQKALRYIIAVHVPTVGIMVLSLLCGWPLVLYPLHIVFLEFVIDPACSIVFEAEPGERDSMRRPPRQTGARTLQWQLIASSLIQGLCVLLAVAALYAAAQHFKIDEATARTMTFSVIVLSNIGLIVANRTRHRNALRALAIPNRAFWWISGGALSGLVLTIYLPALSSLFRFAPLNALQFASAAVAALSGLAVYEIGREILFLSHNNDTRRRKIMSQ
ncbi:MAG TPA: cation-translocating P-type ATPase [Spongiibacteraceae bacterium]|nr:cation-translocating P-type ATPase [Spongiibacteraceae bacterium]